MPDLIGKTIGKYTIEGFIGRGAMAEVYRAYHPLLDRFVAIKILHSFLAEKTGILDRFRREAQNVIGLNHPNIVRVHDFDRDQGLYFMVMEYIDGPTLRDVHRDTHQEGRLMPLQEVIRIVSSVCLALDYAHQRDVIHRDIKPSNVMLDSNKRVVLTDFGLARITSGPQFTVTGAMVGTPAFLSPEQGQGKTGDARSDIYSLGVMMFQLATGQLPFVAETPVAVIFKHINTTVPLPRTINPDIPRSMENIILKMMEKLPEDRYQSAGELVQELTKVDFTEVTQPNLQSSGIIPPVVKPTSELVSVSLHFIETGQIVNLQGGREFMLGRYDGAGAVRPDVDLSPFDGYRMGVSRSHAVLMIDQKKLVQLIDLGSTNGTWINGTRIAHDAPVELRNGDIFSLGKLLIQVLIRY